MSEKLSKALEFANYRATLNNQRAILKARVESLLSYSIDGGTFTIDPGLISFVKTLSDSGLETTVLLDIYKNPIQVNVNDFLSEYSADTPKQPMTTTLSMQNLAKPAV